MKVTSVKFSPLVLDMGGILTVNIGVLNDSTSTITGANPLPGFIYNQMDRFPDLFPAVKDSVMAVAHFFPSPYAFQFRWSVGTLAPGQSALVVGKIRMQIPGGWMFDGGAIVTDEPGAIQGVGQTLVIVNFPGASGVDLTPRVVALEGDVATLQTDMTSEKARLETLITDLHNA